MAGFLPTVADKDATTLSYGHDQSRYRRATWAESCWFGAAANIGERADQFRTDDKTARPRESQLTGRASPPGTADGYSNLSARHRPHATEAGSRPAATTSIDLPATRSQRGAQFADANSVSHARAVCSSSPA